MLYVIVDLKQVVHRGRLQRGQEARQDPNLCVARESACGLSVERVRLQR
jgi:hypothetical protein